MKTLVLGGYGNFGARISRALAADAAIELLVGGRDLERATAFAQSLAGRARAVRVDAQSPDLAQGLGYLGVDLVIHTAGPFQNQDYRVPQAVAAAGAHYIDLADGRRFVCDFPAALDGVFRGAGRTAVTGASTVPALSRPRARRRTPATRRCNARPASAPAIARRHPRHRPRRRRATRRCA